MGGICAESKIPIELLRNYLLSKSWEISDFNELLEKAVSTDPNLKEVFLIIPKREDLIDYTFRLNLIIRSLSTLENRPESVITQDIMKQPGYDILKIEFSSEITQNGTFPLMDMVINMKEIENLIEYSACSEINEGFSFKKIFDDAKSLTKFANFAQTEIGSFIVNIQIPIGDPYFQLVQGGNEEDEDDKLFFVEFEHHGK